MKLTIFVKFADVFQYQILIIRIKVGSLIAAPSIRCQK